MAPESDAASAVRTALQAGGEDGLVSRGALVAFLSALKGGVGEEIVDAFVKRQQTKLSIDDFLGWCFPGQGDLTGSPTASRLAAPAVPWDVVATLPMGHDLTLNSEHDLYMGLADQMYRDMSVKQLQDLRASVSGKIEDNWKHSTLFHIAVADALSKKLMDSFPPLHCTIVFCLYKERNRIVPKGPDVPGESHPHGEDFIRRKHKQMTWLFGNRQADCSWNMIGMDNGCPVDSAGLMETIVKEMGYDNVATHRFKEAVVKGTCPVLDFDKLRSEAWDPSDRLVKASVKGGAMTYALYLAGLETAKHKSQGKRHMIVYTDSDLSTDLGLCGLNFKTIFDGVDCSVSQRFGQACAVNCGRLLEEGGLAPGMRTDSMVHLTLRHKLRMNLLPPLAPIVDSNCGHKAITGEALEGVLEMVREYKASFDMDFLMCVGICSTKAGRTPIDVTGIPWVNSVGESNFWSAGPNFDETAEEAKLRSATSWQKIFTTMCSIFESHRARLQEQGLVSEDCLAYVDWVRALDVAQYVKLTDGIAAQFERRPPTMPEPAILGFELAQMRDMCTGKKSLRRASSKLDASAIAALQPGR